MPCSYFVLVESSDQKRRFPPPWTVEASKDQHRVIDANGVTLACIYSRDDLHASQWGYYQAHLTSDEARRIAKAIARLPELLIKRRGFESRGRGNWRWKPTRPYHVALQDMFVRAHWDEITTLCRFNGIPFDATGERIGRDGLWCVYEFAVQLDAMMFWDQFEGRWLRGDEFFYPDRPDDLPKMKLPSGWEKLVRQSYRG